jgi:hypothetical protein
MSAADVVSPPPARWWDDRWAWRGAIAAAPLGALAGILNALLVERTGFAEALFAYGLWAAVAAGIGCLLLGPLGGTANAVRMRRAERAGRHDADLEADPEADLEHDLEHDPEHDAVQLTLEDASVIDLPEPRRAPAHAA